MCILYASYLSDHVTTISPFRRTVQFLHRPSWRGVTRQRHLGWYVFDHDIQCQGPGTHGWWQPPRRGWWWLVIFTGIISALLKWTELNWTSIYPQQGRLHSIDASFSRHIVRPMVNPSLNRLVAAFLLVVMDWNVRYDFKIWIFTLFCTRLFELQYSVITLLLITIFVTLLHVSFLLLSRLLIAFNQSSLNLEFNLEQWVVNTFLFHKLPCLPVQLKYHGSMIALPHYITLPSALWPWNLAHWPSTSPIPTITPNYRLKYRVRNMIIWYA